MSEPQGRLGRITVSGKNRKALSKLELVWAKAVVKASTKISALILDKHLNFLPMAAKWLMDAQPALSAEQLDALREMEVLILEYADEDVQRPLRDALKALGTASGQAPPESP